MSFDSNLTLKDASNADKVFKETSRQNRRTERTRTDSQAGVKYALIIDHADVKPKGKLAQVRSSIQFASIQKLTGETDIASDRLMLILERTPSAQYSAESIIEDFWAHLTDLMNNPGFRESIVLGES